MKRRGSIAIALISIFVGILIVLQMKTVDLVGGSIDSERASDLAAELLALENENNELVNQLNAAQSELSQYESELAGSDDVIEKRQKELESERILAGVVDVSGEGLIITIDIDNREYDKEIDMSQYSKTADYLLALVNELNSAGAEAVSINDERITSRTEIRQAGNYININRRKYAVPFEVRVIGNAQDLSAAIKMRAGIVDTMEAHKLKVTINQNESVNIKAHQDIIETKYATPILDDTQSNEAMTNENADGT